jgi:hypothetical protein
VTGTLVESIVTETGAVLEVWRFPSIVGEALARLRLMRHFGALDQDFPDEGRLLAGQMTVDECIAIASLPAQEGRYRDQRADSDTK